MHKLEKKYFQFFHKEEEVIMSDKAWASLLLGFKFAEIKRRVVDPN